jgi:hypothetical protein|tara:strand:+ start:61 stop:399 length:339 start_codon:yes stop_codon:yes gene_type:complete
MANAYKLHITTLTAATPTDCYTVPAATVGIIKSISVYNANVGAAALTLSIYDSSSTSSSIYDKNSLTTVSKNEFLKGDTSTVLILEEGDKIQFLSDVANPIVTISVLQQDRT